MPDLDVTPEVRTGSDFLHFIELTVEHPLYAEEDTDVLLGIDQSLGATFDSLELGFKCSSSHGKIGEVQQTVGFMSERTADEVSDEQITAVTAAYLDWLAAQSPHPPAIIEAKVQTYQLSEQAKPPQEVDITQVIQELATARS